MSFPRTPSQTVGPYYAIGLCRRPDNELVPRGHPGAVELRGSLFDGAGTPVGDGVIEIWDTVGGRWGRCGTHPDGNFSFVIAKPPATAGEAPRLDVYVFARGLLKHQLARLYFPDEPRANASDPVLSGLDDRDRSSLVASEENGGLRFDITLQGDEQTVFFSS